MNHSAFKNLLENQNVERLLAVQDKISLENKRKIVIEMQEKGFSDNEIRHILCMEGKPNYRTREIKKRLLDLATL